MSEHSTSPSFPNKPTIDSVRQDLCRGIKPTNAVPCPTPEEMRADLFAALLICNEASDGPWRSSGYPDLILDADGRTVCQMDQGVFVTPDGKHALPTMDALFIRAAREDWPIALRRAMLAETLLDRLRDSAAKLSDPAALADELRAVLGFFHEVRTGPTLPT
jgi:hypothetical protein